LVTFSTDYVFNGRSSEPYLESSIPDPVNTYGRSKLAGERSSIDANPQSLVIRTSWVVSGTHPNFVATMLRLAKNGEPFQVVIDQHGCPTVADDLATATINALSESVTGLLHLTNQGPATWFELAVEAVSSAGLDPGLVLPCSTTDFPTRAKRPAYSVLGSERLEHLAVSPLPAWRSSLPDLVARLQETPHV
jgi:dTDP-4-dehydrorhamnose reductase